jgi:hypothetical protein
LESVCIRSIKVAAWSDVLKSRSRKIMVLPNLQMLDVALLGSLVAAAPQQITKKKNHQFCFRDELMTLFGIFCCWVVLEIKMKNATEIYYLNKNN